MSESVAKYVLLRFRASLERFTDYVTSVKVRIEDLNGPRGGEDKRCQATLSLASGGTVAIAATSGDAYSAIDWAARKARQTLARRLEKQRIRRK